MKKVSYIGWKIIEEEFIPSTNAKNETIFSLGNGYIGMRGNFEEGYSGNEDSGVEGNYLNGFYESEFIKYGETAYGYAEKSQTMLNVTNAKIMKLFIDDEEFTMEKGSMPEYIRELDMQEGVLKRRLIWLSPKGKKVLINIERIVPFTEKHLAAICMEITPMNFSGDIKIISAIDGDVKNLTAKDDPRVGSGLTGRAIYIKDRVLDGEFGALVQSTKNTEQKLVCAMYNHLEGADDYAIENVCEDFMIKVIYRFHGEEGKKVRLNKYISYVSSKYENENEILNIAKEKVLKGKYNTFEGIKKKQRLYLNDFWHRSDVSIKGDDNLQKGIRFNMFQLLQSVGKDGITAIGAKGLTGEGYEGHYFWDTEIFVLPFFLYTNPYISRKLLEYRYNTLDKARERAKQMGHSKGALYAWRTINGEESSAYYPAGTAQYHINAAIAFAIKKYIEATEDKEFMIRFGAEILFETARLWADLGCYIESKGNKFCINEVTGPNEYSTLVNNNCYTNFMARENLSFAYETAKWMRENASEEYAYLCDKISLLDTEIDSWKKAAEDMYIPYDEKLKIHPQDDSFLYKALWNFKDTPKENYPLLLHYHPLVIYRHQVCKQADLILAEFLLGDKFSLNQKKRDYDFYEKLTTHDSSLSPCIFSIMASEIGYRDKAYRYFYETATLDLDDKHGNTKDGIHVANMAGAWMCIANGFGGMRVYNGILSFRPYLPKEWKEYSFNVVYKGRLINIKVDEKDSYYKLLEGEEIEIMHNGEKVIVK